jgi:hypothetical protein
LTITIPKTEAPLHPSIQDIYSNQVLSAVLLELQEAERILLKKAELLYTKMKTSSFKAGMERLKYFRKYF